MSVKKEEILYSQNKRWALMEKQQIKGREKECVKDLRKGEQIGEDIEPQVKVK